MYDDLARIESCYGSVAEYYRCKEEEGNRYSGYEPTYDELVADGEYEDVPFPRETPLTYQFKVGQKIKDYEFDGGYTIYGISRITKDRTKVLVTETWFNVDGYGKRKPHWCRLIEDEYGNEKFQIDPSYDSWISAKEGR